MISGYSSDIDKLSKIMATNPNCKYLNKPVGINELKCVLDSYE